MRHLQVPINTPPAAQERENRIDFGNRVEHGGGRTALGFGGQPWGRAIGVELLEARGEGRVRVTVRA